MSIDTYMKTMMKMVFSRKEKAGIKRELQDCIEDLTEKYLNQGLDYKEAEEEAIRQMGDPREAAEMFNVVYSPKFEWRTSAYMLIWSIIVYLCKLGLIKTIDATDSLMFCTFCGILFIVCGMVLSYSEKSGDFPFLWWKISPTKYWALPGLGVFSNSCAICGLGIALLAINMKQLIILFGALSIVMIFQRLFIEIEQGKFEQNYLYKDCIAIESFDYQGKVSIGTEHHVVQIRKGQQTCEGEELLVTGTKGFMLIVEKL